MSAYPGHHGTLFIGKLVITLTHSKLSLSYALKNQSITLRGSDLKKINLSHELYRLHGYLSYTFVVIECCMHTHAGIS
jgi:hypothetical protein